MRGKTFLREVFVLGLAWVALGLGGWGCAAWRVKPWNPVEPLRDQERPVGRVYAYCVWAGTFFVPAPCEKRVELVEVQEGPCPGERCGHVLAEHTPSDPKGAGLFDAIGYIRDQIHAGEAFELPGGNDFYRGCHTEPVMGEYWYEYVAGQVMGDIKFRITYRTVPDCPERGDRWRFLTREEDPESCCVRVRWVSGNPPVHECECEWTISARYLGLQELPPPPYQTPQGEQFPYVRCGRTGPACDPDRDSPNTWAAHPSVHWGRPEMNDALKCLAWKGFEACSRWRLLSPPEDPGRVEVLEDAQSLAITDMSLPGGGLLDINLDWGTPHRWHRQGCDADLVGVSVPADGRCGPRPTGTYDPRWRHTKLWDRDFLRVIRWECGIEPPFEGDPGHVRLVDAPR